MPKQQSTQPIKMMVIFISLLIAFAMALLLVKNAEAAISPMRICTGAEGGFYEQIGNSIGQAITTKADTAFTMINTVENAELMRDGECDLGILQADAVTTLPLPRGVVGRT